MITCPACSKQNQDHYRFCLGCGAELPRGGAAAQPSRPEAEDPVIQDEETNVGGTVSQLPPDPTPAPPEQPVVRAAALEEPADDDAAPLPPGKCPECDYVNPPTNRFCASCGFRLDQVQVAKKPKPVPVEDGELGAILIALDPEGNEVGRHRLAVGESIIGRSSGGIFAGDTFLSPQHAVFVAEHGKVRVRDAGSLNGVFRKLLAEQRSPLASGQRFRIGQELLQYDELAPEKTGDDGVSAQGTNVDGVVGTVSLVVGRETARPSHPLFERGMNLGRERGDVLFPEDGYVSGLHCHVSYEDGDVFVTDLGSSNGTFVQLLGDTELRNGDVLLMGQQLFRLTC